MFRSVLVAAGLSAMLGASSVAAPASADCVYTPAKYGYYTTDYIGNDPSVYESGGCDVFYMSRGALGPSYQWWLGWLKKSSGGWYEGAWGYDGTSGEGVPLELGVLYNTNEHAQTAAGGGWRNEEYH